MPNHVENRLTFDCSRERLQEILTAISRDQDKEVDGKFGVGTFDFEKVIPMPEDIYRGNLGPAERELYGKKNWYDWSVWNWGTKWNSYSNRFDGDTLYFHTAWAAPHPVIEKLSEQFPDVRISHRWADEDLGCNCGERDYLKEYLSSSFTRTNGASKLSGYAKQRRQPIWLPSLFLCQNTGCERKDADR